MIQIQDVQIGFPYKKANVISVSTLPIKTDDKNCSLYYELYEQSDIDNSLSQCLANGNLELSDEEFANWDDTMTYIEDLALNKLNLERL